MSSGLQTTGIDCPGIRSVEKHQGSMDAIHSQHQFKMSFKKDVCLTHCTNKSSELLLLVLVGISCCGLFWIIRQLYSFFKLTIRKLLTLRR